MRSRSNLGQSAEYGQHQSAMRCCGIGPRVAERTKASFFAGNRCQRVQQIAGRAGQPVEPHDHQHVAALELRERPA
jgi:hypothetical protein